MEVLMAQLNRKSIGFSDREVAQIEDILTDEAAPALIDNVLYGSAEGMTSPGGPESFSDVVRKLALVGLGRVHKAQLAAQYRATAEVAAEYFSDADLTAMAHTALGAIDDLTASKAAEKPLRRRPSTRDDDMQRPAGAHASDEVAESHPAEA
jgi:hypothetical protein